MKNFHQLLVEKRGAAFWIILNDPETRNAFSLDMASEFLQALRAAIKNKDVSVIVISGTGQSFSAGGNIKMMNAEKNLSDFFRKISQMINTVVLEMRKSEKPILAAIPGYVGGIAFGMLLGTDLRIASSKAQFCAATIRLGLVANGSATYFLPRMVGLARANEILFLGDIFSADEALKMGLINRVVPSEQLENETQQIAERLAASPQKALGRLKKIVNESLTSTLRAQLERERQSIAWSSTTPDFQEGMKAFLEKRASRFNES